MQHISFRLKHLDLTLAVTCLLLLMIGMALIYSTTLNGSKALLYHQIVYALAGVALFIFFASFDYRALTKSSRYLYVIFVLMLVVLLVLGRVIKGSSRWFDFKVITFQPAEFMKLIMVLVLARFFALRRGEINNWKNITLSFIYALIPVALIAKQPDLGSAIVIFIVWLGMLFFSTVNKKVFVYIFLGLAVAAGLSWNFLLHDYQRSRIETFIYPNSDVQGQGYNVRQAMIAVGSGEFIGRGLGKGLQSQLRFLPERNTDFIFAASAEELGFLGCAVIIILYFVLFYRLLIIYNQSRDDLSRFVIAGIFFMIFGQTFINIGMNIGLLPVTGIPLPLISYGGSSLFTVIIALGIAESVAMRSKGLRL